MLQLCKAGRHIILIAFQCFLHRCYARLHPRAVNCRKKKCGHSNQVCKDISDCQINLCTPYAVFMTEFGLDPLFEIGSSYCCEVFVAVTELICWL